MSRRTAAAGPLLILLGGPAGAGKSTLALAWCEKRERAAHIDLDEIRQMIVGGFADPQQSGPVQAAQFGMAARQCVLLAQNFLKDGFDAVIESVFTPDEYQATWKPLLDDLNPVLVILLPDLATTLGRATRREKDVLVSHTRSQHAASLKWPQRNRLDTAGQTIGESRQALHDRIADLRLNQEN